MESNNLIRRNKLEINQIKSKDKFDNLKSDYFLYSNIKTKIKTIIFRLNLIIKN